MDHKLPRKYLLFVFTLVLGGLSGCNASLHEMGVSGLSNSFDVRKKSLVLMTLSVSHPSRPAYVPTIDFLSVEDETLQRQGALKSFFLDDDGTVTDNDRTSYEVRMSLAPGNYMLRFGMGSVTYFTSAYIVIPFAMHFTVPANSVVYIGHIEAMMRPWRPGDFLAGPRAPMLPQTTLGVLDSSFDVTVQDRTQNDLKLFGGDFPVLVGAPVKVDMMSSFNREDAYKFWLTLSPYE